MLLTGIEYHRWRRRRHSDLRRQFGVVSDSLASWYFATAC